MAPQYESEPYGLQNKGGPFCIALNYIPLAHRGSPPRGDDIFMNCKQYH